MKAYIAQSASWILIAIGLLLLPACDDATVPGDTSETLAIVNGEAITQAQLDASLINLFGEQQALEFDATARRKALEGLVASRAIAQRSMEEIDQQERVALEFKVMLYRDKLLMGEYLKDHAQPEPVTDDMVKEYYEQHLQDFGGGSRKTFEVLMTADKPSSDKRQELIKHLSEAEKNSDWSELSSEFKRKGLNINYRKGETDSDALDPALLKIVSALTVTQTSPVAFIDGKPLVIRVLSATDLTAVPLHDVSAAIRKRLLPVQLKVAVKAVQTDVLKDAQVEYFTE
jgi:hypothetical protein